MRLLVSFFLIVLVGCNTSQKKQEDSEKASLHLQIGNQHILNQNYPMALKELLVAEELDPQNAYTQSSLGLVYFMRDRFELAEKHYQKSIKLKPDFTDAKNNLGRIYVEVGRLVDAEKLLKEVLSDLTYVDFHKTYLNYGILDYKRKKYKSAIQYLKNSLERDRENCLAHAYLGRCYLDQNELDISITQLEKAIPFCKDAGFDDAHYYSAIALYRNKEYTKAKNRFEETYRTFPNGSNNEKAQKMLKLITEDGL